jgi:hypothetical protein
VLHASAEATVSMPEVLHTTRETFHTQGSLSWHNSAKITDATEYDIYGRVTEPVSGKITLLCIIGRVHFVFKKQPCQLAMADITDVNNDNTSENSDSSSKKDV